MNHNEMSRSSDSDEPKVEEATSGNVERRQKRPEMCWPDIVVGRPQKLSVTVSL